jgi:hypothetical protein
MTASERKAFALGYLLARRQMSRELRRTKTDVDERDAIAAEILRTAEECGGAGHEYDGPVIDGEAIMVH